MRWGRRGGAAALGAALSFALGTFGAGASEPEPARGAVATPGPPVTAEPPGASDDSAAPGTGEPTSAVTPAARPAEPPAADDPEPHRTVVRDSRAPGRPATSEVRAAEIARSGARSAADVLEQMPAVVVQSGRRGERIFSVRGFEQRQSAVQLDGAPFAAAYDGQVDLGAVPAALLERVAVYAGPASLGDGPAALGGVVQLTTRWPGVGPLATATLERGTDGAVRLSASHDGRAGALGWRLYGSGEQQRSFPLAAGFAPTPLQAAGARVNSDRSGGSVGADVAWAPSTAQRVRASALWVDASRGVPPSAVEDVPRYWRFDVWRALALNVVHSGRYGVDGAVEVDERVYFQRFDNRLDGYDDGRYASQDTARAFRSWYHDQTVGGRVAVRAVTAAGALGVLRWQGALDLRHDRHARPEADGADAVASRTTLGVGAEVEAAPADGLQVSVGGHLEVEVPGGGLDADTGLVAGGGPQLLARLDVAPAWTLGASVARRTRIPTLKDRFSGAMGARLPNPELRPESAWRFGVDATWRPSASLRVDAALFDAEVGDLIELVRTAEGLEQLRNSGAARLVGGELAVRWAPSRRWSFSAGAMVLSARRAGGATGPLAYRPDYRGTAGVVLAPWAGLELSTALRVVGPQAFEDPNTRVWRTLGAGAVVDLRAEVRLGAVAALWVRASNVLDAALQTEYGFPEPGRELWLGVRFEAPAGSGSEGQGASDGAP